MRSIGFRNKLRLFIKVTFLYSFAFLQGCSNNIIGEQLSNSFDEPTIDSKLENISNEVKVNDSDKLINKNTLKLTKSKNKLNNSEVKSTKLIGRIDNKRKVIPYTPRPYRITIKLSGANPASPSESVTNALIKAGVEFEVEMIERVGYENDKNNSSKRGASR